jgi:hypothetical protein
MLNESCPIFDFVCNCSIVEGYVSLLEIVKQTQLSIFTHVKIFYIQMNITNNYKTSHYSIYRMSLFILSPLQSTRINKNSIDYTFMKLSTYSLALVFTAC